jgi:hypothetical protein
MSGWVNSFTMLLTDMPTFFLVDSRWDLEPMMTD